MLLFVLLQAMDGEGVCDEARGFELPYGWTQSLVHGSKLALLDSISAKCEIDGGAGGRGNRAN